MKEGGTLFACQMGFQFTSSIHPNLPGGVSPPIPFLIRPGRKNVLAECVWRAAPKKGTWKDYTLFLKCFFHHNIHVCYLFNKG